MDGGAPFQAVPPEECVCDCPECPEEIAAEVPAATGNVDNDALSVVATPPHSHVQTPFRVCTKAMSGGVIRIKPMTAIKDN